MEEKKIKEIVKKRFEFISYPVQLAATKGAEKMRSQFPQKRESILTNTVQSGRKWKATR